MGQGKFGSQKSFWFLMKCFDKKSVQKFSTLYGFQKKFSFWRKHLSAQQSKQVYSLPSPFYFIFFRHSFKNSKKCSAKIAASLRNRKKPQKIFIKIKYLQKAKYSIRGKIRFSGRVRVHHFRLVAKNQTKWTKCVGRGKGKWQITKEIEEKGEIEIKQTNKKLKE